MPPPKKPEPQPYRCRCDFTGTFDEVVDHVAKRHREDPSGGHAVMLREHYARAKDDGRT